MLGFWEMCGSARSPSNAQATLTESPGDLVFRVTGYRHIRGNPFVGGERLHLRGRQLALGVLISAWRGFVAAEISQTTFQRLRFIPSMVAIDLDADSLALGTERLPKCA